MASYKPKKKNRKVKRRVRISKKFAIVRKDSLQRDTVRKDTVKSDTISKTPMPRSNSAVFKIKIKKK